MKKILLLGSGMVGTAIAADLAGFCKLTVADIDISKLTNLAVRYNAEVLQLDLKNKSALMSLMKDKDIIVSAVPGFLGYETLTRIIEAGKDVVDISFFPEDPFELNDLAIERDVTAVVDCGIAPGLSNIILGYNNARLKIRSFRCYVGGLPFERNYPYEYKAPFSPSDVIEEYIRPARIREDGNLKIKPALSEPELIHFHKIGTLEAFNSDGLRSLLKTMDIPDMVEKTLRYPGHLEAVKMLRDSGFFSDEEIEVKGLKIKPVDVSSKLLFNLWKLAETDNEFTVLRLVIETDEKEIIYNLFDVRDQNTGFSSMARTTGFTCSAVVNLMANGKIKRKGICPPEYIGIDEGNFNYVKEYLKDRNVVFNEDSKDIT